MRNDKGDDESFTNKSSYIVAESFITSFVASLTYELLFSLVKKVSFVKRLLSHPFIVVLVKKIITFSPMLILL